MYDIQKTDVIIIGAGPCGLFAVFAAEMHVRLAHACQGVPARRTARPRNLMHSAHRLQTLPRVLVARAL